MNQEKQNYTKDQLKVIALKQRIGEITSNYEEQIADMRATVTQQAEAMQEVMSNQQNEIERLKAELENYVQEKAGNKKSSD